MEKQRGGNITVLGEETCFDGFLEFTDTLVVTGKFEGTIKSEGVLDIAKTAECEVDEMSATSITVAGAVKGNINAYESLEIKSGSRINGDIKTKKLRVAENVEYQGAVTMLDDVQDVDIFAVSPAEFKEQLQSGPVVEEPADEAE